MNKLYDLSWQAVGISSDRRIERDPLSLHMQNYLMWGSRHSHEHVVVVDDVLQAYNYQAFYNLNFHDASWQVQQKGRQKLDDLSSIARAHRLSNITFTPLSKIRAASGNILTQLQELYTLKGSFYESVQSIFPVRLVEGLDIAGRDLCAQYILGELALNLQLGGVRISTTKETQRRVNEVSTELHTQYCLGEPISFVYPKELGQECELGENGRVEPYSAAYGQKRILLSDSRKTLVEKCSQATGEERRAFSRWIRRTTGCGLHPLRRLYGEHIERSHIALRRNSVRKTGRIVGEFTFASCIMGAVLATGFYLGNLHPLDTSNSTTANALIAAVERCRK